MVLVLGLLCFAIPVIIARVAKRKSWKIEARMITKRSLAICLLIALLYPIAGSILDPSIINRSLWHKIDNIYILGPLWYPLYYQHYFLGWNLTIFGLPLDLFYFVLPVYYGTCWGFGLCLNIFHLYLLLFLASFTGWTFGIQVRDKPITVRDLARLLLLLITLASAIILIQSNMTPLMGPVVIAIFFMWLALEAVAEELRKKNRKLTH